MLEDNEKYKTMISNLRQEKGFAESPMGKDAAKVDQFELERLEKAKVAMELKIKEQEKLHRKDIKQWDRSIREKEQKYHELQRILKEREQENRISKLKLKEMKRLIKHNQLKPLSQMTPGSINGDIPEDGSKPKDPKNASVATSKTK